MKTVQKVEDTYLQKRFAGLFSQSERTLAQSEIITAPNQCPALQTKANLLRVPIKFIALSVPIEEILRFSLCSTEVKRRVLFYKKMRGIHSVDFSPWPTSRLVCTSFNAITPEQKPSSSVNSISWRSRFSENFQFVQTYNLHENNY